MPAKQTAIQYSRYSRFVIAESILHGECRSVDAAESYTACLPLPKIGLPTECPIWEGVSY